MEKCLLCDYQSDNKISFAKHVLHTHKLKKPEYLIQTKYGGSHPLCECGCGTKMTYRAYIGDFPRYIKKHLGVLLEGKTFEEIWGDPNSPKRVEAISNARKKKFASGEYEHVREAVRENRKQPTLGDNISRGATGVPKPKPEGFGVGRIHSELTKNKMSDVAIERIISHDKQHSSQLELDFLYILKELNIEYTRFFYAKSIRAFYDVYIESHNTLIEVDGDFYHCNPIKFPEPKYITQKKNLIRDQEKNQWAIDNGYTILRFWEHDINNNLDQVKNILKEHFKTI
jgi:very-short-patch-repair endonuclease